MDKKTQKAYSVNALEYSRGWLAQPQPQDVYSLLKKFFIPDGITADIGCGNGRDSNWMSLNGFNVTGYDSNQDLLKLASQLYSHIRFEQAFLPSLKQIKEQFDNVFCETVIMHLPRSELVEGVQGLKSILKDKGSLYLSWRVTEGEDMRHKDGRLYSSFESSLILDQFPKSSVLHFEDKISESSGKRVCRLISKSV